MGEALVVGAEVEAPVRHAVRLVDDEQTTAGQQRRQLGGETRIGQPLRRDQQEVHRSAAHAVEHARPVLDVRRVDRRGHESGSPGGGDLVAHQSEQRRDDDRVTLTGGAQRTRRRPVHRRLPPPGRLHHEHSGPVVDERPDGHALVGAWHGSVSRHRGDRVLEMGVSGDHRGSVPNDTVASSTSDGLVCAPTTEIRPNPTECGTLRQRNDRDPVAHLTHIDVDRGSVRTLRTVAE